MKKAVLNDRVYEEELTKNGFILIRNFLYPEQIDEMLDLYKSHHSETDKERGMWNSLYNVATDTGLNISDHILACLKPNLDLIFESYDAPVATFMSKNANKFSTCELHRDYSNADETQFQYRNVWIPLVPTNINNGALYVVKGSNHVFDYVLPMFCQWPYTDAQSELFEYAETIECNAGDLVIYLDKTLHGSHINYTKDSRPVIHFGVLHPDVQLLFYFLNRDNNQVRTYEVPFRFFFGNDFSEPKGLYPLNSEFDYAPPHLSMDDIRRRLKSPQ